MGNDTLSSSSSSSDEAEAPDFAKLLAAADTPTFVVRDGLVKKLDRTLMIESEDIDVNKPLYKYRFDSLIAVESRSWFAEKISAEVAVFDIMGSTSMAYLAGVVTDKSRFVVAVKRDEAE